MDARITAGGAADWLRSRSVRKALPLVALISAMLLVGCQADPNMQLVERELRLQDSHIFELEEHLADCHTSVAEYRREIESLRRQLADGQPVPPAAPSPDDYYRDEDDDWDPDSRLRPPRPGGANLPNIDEGDEIPAPPRRVPLDTDAPLEPFEDLGDAEAPEFIPPADDAEPSLPMPGSSEDGLSLLGAARAEIPAGAEMEEELPSSIPRELDGEVAQIGLRLMVRYHAAENTPVELQTLIEPQDVDAEQVVTEGDVSLMVMATDGGTERPLARWDFTEDEARRHWKRSRLGTGMLFQLPWPGTPQAGTYRLWARMTGNDGRKHLSSADFEVHEAALAAPPAVPTPLQLVLPGPGEPAEPEPAGEMAVLTPAEERPHEPEPFVPSADQAEPRHSAEPAPAGAESSRAEPRSASSAGPAWKASVEAARLPRLPRPTRVPPAATASDPAAGPQDDAPIVPWSPERPNAHHVPKVQSAERTGEWSPYR